ncbi:MAG: TVP38/TMEM64 family protein [Gemmatimonadetes bacterium]|nr:TVP38/TMEM64 family protein [Gemmatimonadota bacterium]
MVEAIGSRQGLAANSAKASHERAAQLKARIILAVVAVALVALAAWQWEWDTSGLESWIGQHAVLGAGIYVVLVAASVVLLPFSSLPLRPLAARSYGVVLTALLSAAGWWTGCLIAFRIARLGRRYLERITSMEAVDRLEEKVPDDVGFGGIVVLRMILPVDVVSFALGLLKRLRFRTYAVASLVGILPFAFVWSYAGGQLGTGRFLSFALVVAGMAAVVLVVRRQWRAYR